MYEYDADDEYDINDEEDRFEAIDKQVFINIGAYMGQIFNDPLAEFTTLHGCKEEQTTHIMGNVGACRQPIRSTDSELFSLSSEQTDNTVFEYYISDDHDIELT